MIGIYKIENKVNGKVYIGQSIDIDNRWKQHINELDSKGHINKHLQYAWDKYGSDSFEFSIVEILPNLDLIDEREQYWIEYYKAFYKDNGYNMTRGGKGTQQISHEDIDKIYKLHNSPSNVYTPKEIGEIIGYDQKTIRRILHNGNLFNRCDYNPEKGSWISIICLNTLEVFDSMKDCAIWCNLKNPSMIGYNLRQNKSIGRHPETKQKLYWMYYEDYLKSTPEYIDSIIPVEESGIICVETQKIFGLIKDAKDFCGLRTQDGIVACCKGEAITSGGYHWKYYKDYLKEIA